MYIDTANIEEIKQALKTGIIKGVTTNPTILKKEKKDRFEQIDDIMKLNPKILFVQLIGETVEQWIEDYKKIMEYIKNKNYNIGIKIPMTFEALETIKRIREENPSIKILGTAIYSSEQVMLSAIAGCDMVAPYVNRMQNNSIDPYHEISKMRQFIEDRGYKTEILSASFKNTSQVIEALISGSHTCTIPFDILKQMMDKELAKFAIKVFNEDANV